jgi:hypothetical protein
MTALHLLFYEVASELPGAVGSVAEDLGAGRLLRDEARRRIGVAGVASRQVGGGDDAGVRLGREMRLVAVTVGVLGLVGMAGLWVDCRDDAVRSGALGDPPGTRPFSWLHVLAGDECEQGHGVFLCLVEIESEVLGGKDELVGVVHEL